MLRARSINRNSPRLEGGGAWFSGVMEDQVSINFELNLRKNEQLPYVVQAQPHCKEKKFLEFGFKILQFEQYYCIIIM